jgi:hypothetical protein
MAELVEQYSNFPLGGTDASVVALAERLDAQPTPLPGNILPWWYDCPS